MSSKLWIHRESDYNEVERLALEAGISRLLAKVLISRGIKDAAYVRDFLYPDIRGIYSPFLLKDMEKASARIAKAIEKKEHIVIYGDYDVDGVTSTSILLDFLKSAGADADFYIPDRFDEGYGLSEGAVERVLQMSPNLVVTVDCGITAVEEIKRLEAADVSVIVTDHHQCKDVLPDATAVINPHRPDCQYPFKELAGVGVVFKLVHALCLTLGLCDEYLKYLDLVALGTIADVAELVGENRTIVKFGLPAIEKSTNPGLRALINVSGLREKSINTYAAGFALAPRINAAGRTGSAARAVKLFTTSDLKLAEEIAKELNEENKYRQQTEADILQQALEYVEARVDLQKEKVIVAAGSGWHHGIIGIVASRITEKYHRPCILISEEDGLGRGSGRSIEGFNLFLALAHCESYLMKFGGHELAAGLSLDLANLPAFIKSINDYADSCLASEALIPRIKIDSRLEMDDMNIDSVQELDLLSPFGPGNPSPVFSIEALRLSSIKTVGEGRHLKLRLEGKGAGIDAIGFNMGGLAGSYLVPDILDCVFSLDINSWNNCRNVQMVLKDVRKDVRPHKAIVFDSLNDYNINKVNLEDSSIYRELQGLKTRLMNKNKDVV